METENEDLFGKLGYLFYAIAAAEGKVRLSEINALHKEFSRYWFTVEDAALSKNLMLTTFNDLLKRRIPAESAFGEFRNYYLQNKGQFDGQLKSRISETAAAIAAAFAGNNKSELTYLAQLYLLMK